MMHKIPVTDAIAIVFTRQEFGYSDVIATLPEALWVDVVTYNISSNDNPLLTTLRTLDVHVKIRVITNIPKRFQDYWGPTPRARFQEVLANYRILLDPKGFGSLSSFFNVSNHSKIVMTDRLAYIGSANFSSESADSYECGVLFSDPAVIQTIRHEIVDAIVEASAPHDLSEIGEAKLFFQSIRGQLKELLLSLKEGFYAPLDDMGEGKESFRWQDAEISADLLVRFTDFLDEAESGLETYEDHPQLAAVAELVGFGGLQELRGMVGDEISPLVRLADWNEQDRTDAIFQEYAHEAYDEKVDHYMEIACSKAAEELEELVAEARKTLNKLGSVAVAVYKATGTGLAKLQELEDTKWEVDNT